MWEENEMKTFLEESKKALGNLQSYAKVRVVMGNSTCDLDSAVCALAQGFLEYLDTQSMYMYDVGVVIPLMNIPRKEYRLKTEVTYFFELHNISPDLLTFRDEIDLKKLSNPYGNTTLEVVLVDHHALPEEDRFLTDSVIRVIDHRPRDKNWPWPDIDVCIEPVGSCATLVARRFLDERRVYANYKLLHLLRGAILIDTCNLSKKTKRATPIDIETLERIEQEPTFFVYKNNECFDRASVYKRLIHERSNIAELSIADLLNKDVKVVDGVPIAVLPVSIRKIVENNSPPIVMEPLCDFAVARNTRKVVLIGTETVVPDQHKRDYALFSLSPAPESPVFKRADHNSLRSHHMFEIMHMDFFSSDFDSKNGFTRVDYNGRWEMLVADLEDVTVTRKQILPRVREMIQIYDDFQIVNRSRPQWLEEKSFDAVLAGQLFQLSR